MTKNRASIVFLLGLTAVALSLCYVLISPFLKPIVFSAVLAVLFFPLHSQIHRFIRNRNVSALVSTVMVILLIALSVMFLGRAIATGLRDIYQSLGVSADDRERLGTYLLYLFERAIELLSRYLPISVSNLRNATVNQAEKSVAVLLNITAGALGSISSMVANAFIAFFLLFFFFRDGRGMLRRASVVLPLKREQVRRLFARVQDTLHAIVYGTLAMAALQGALAGVAFWMLGVTSPVLWAIVTALCALLPVIGTAIVLLPAISMLVFSGHWIKGLILFAWGMAVVHPVDNVLRPYLIGGRVKLSTLYVFFAVIGGLKAFGTLGLFMGPLILAITVALFTFLREEQHTGSWDLQLPSRPELRLGAQCNRGSNLMEVTSLIDHAKTGPKNGITTEWGLSLHVKGDDFSMLFDMGSSGHFIDNAAALGIDIQSVDLAVLSHGHFDHGGGLRSFLVANSKAVVHMRRGADADLYAKLFGFKRYVGLEKEVLSLYKDRIRFLDQSTELRGGVFAIILVKESYPPPRGNRFLFRRRGSALSLDDFSHELALAVEADCGIVVFTGCSHHGTLNILAAVKDALPDRPIKSLFGGFHLVSLPLSWTLSEDKKSVRALGQALLQSGVDKFYTSHCTGSKGYRILKDIMGERLEYFSAGSRVRV